MHNRTDTWRQNWEDCSTPPATRLRREYMLIIGVLITTLTAVVVIAKRRVPGGVSAAKLGWMSPQWLAEYRASHPS